MREGVREWTDYEIARVKLLWSQGYTGAYIGADLGRSKNAVIGKVTRLKLAPTDHEENAEQQRSVRKAREAKVRRMKRQQVKVPKLVHKTSVVSWAPPLSTPDMPDLASLRGRAWEPLEGTLPKPLEALDHHSCRWPTGDSPFLFCAAPIKGVGFVYCPTHTAMSDRNR